MIRQTRVQQAPDASLLVKVIISFIDSMPSIIRYIQFQIIIIINIFFIIYEGDERLNQHASLTALHTIWLREHNRVAKELARQMPGRSDHFYFQQARRIVIAEFQHITYNEYLPTILGKYKYSYKKHILQCLTSLRPY
jgi:hypothetical protein